MEIGKTYLMRSEYDNVPFEMKVLDISYDKQYFKFQRLSTSDMVPMGQWSEIKIWVIIQEMKA